MSDSCATPGLLCPWDFPGSSVQEICQARILEWVAISFSRGSSGLKDWTFSSCVGRCILYHWTTWEAQCLQLESLISLLMMQSYALSLSHPLHLCILLPLQGSLLALKFPRACENVLCLELDIRAESRSGIMTQLFPLIIICHRVLFCWGHPHIGRERAF